MRLIDADALIIKVRDLVEKYERRMPYWSMNDMLTSGRDAATKWGYKADGVEDALKLIIDAPIIKVESIKHGRWIATNDDTKKRCSECDIICYIAVYPHGAADYCPNCGARMDGDKNDSKNESDKGIYDNTFIKNSNIPTPNKKPQMPPVKPPKNHS